MTYEECLEYLNRLGNEILTMKFGLSTTRLLLRALGDPQKGFPAVLVAGTNGKGSVIRFLDAICRAGGMRTGLFTSPHLVKIEERFQVEGRTVQPEEFAEAFSTVLRTVDTLRLETHPTFFELIAVSAIQCFAEKGVELALLEVGMGGRLDSTNAVEPILSIITPISMDHQQYLGDSLPLIAREKAGILRSSRPALVAPQTAEVEEALMDAGARTGAQLEAFDGSTTRVIGQKGGCYRFTYRDVTHTLQVPGEHQVGNAALAIRAAEILAAGGIPMTPAGISTGVSSVPHIPGVLQIISGDPILLLDGGHNPAAAEALARFVATHLPRPISMIFGIMKDKDPATVLKLLSKHMDQVFLTRIGSPRSADPHELKRFTRRGVVIEDPVGACSAALRSDPAAVVVAGSFYLIGELISRGVLAEPK